MRINDLEIDGAFLIEGEPAADERGDFTRIFSVDEFARRGLTTNVDQCSFSFNVKRGTLRGLHLQLPPDEETKLVICASGAIYDVIVDLRRDSPSFLKWQSFELEHLTPAALYIPPGVAHGFLTLADATRVYYQIAGVYRPEHATGHRWDDPAFGIRWPAPVEVISERDASYPDFVL